MAKYDWEKLRRKFVTSSAKTSLKQFAVDNNIPYGLLRDNAKGWLKEKQTKQRQKTDKIINNTIDRQIESEVEMNLKHYNIATTLLSVLEKSAKIDEMYTSPKSINSLAKSLETIQKVQRIASGVEKDTGKGDIINDFMEAVINGNNENPNK